MTIIYGYTFLTVKDLMDDGVTVFSLVGIRFAIGAAAVCAAKKIMGFFARANPSVKKTRVSVAEIKVGAGLGAVIFLGFAAQTMGAIYTTPAKSGLLTGLYVVFVPIVVMISRGRFSFKSIFAAVLGFFGITLISGLFGKEASLNIGDALTIFSAAAYAADFIILEKYAPSLDSFNFTAVRLFVVSALGFACSAAFERNAYALILLNADKYILDVLFLGLFASGAAYLAQTFAQKRLSANMASLIMCMESVFAALFSVIFGYDRVTWRLALGGAIIVAAMLISSAGSQSGESVTEENFIKEIYKS
ncbi:MAG: DMT family transporter [Clostridiales bacterium]|nr:DMT family transporter [Clostridiales bacterium]